MTGSSTLGDSTLGDSTLEGSTLEGSTLDVLLGDDEWYPVCAPDTLTPGRGVAALLPDGRQVAVFLDRSGRPYAISNRDPFSGAYVLSRGLTGTHEGRFFVASPLLKQRFELATGRCLDDEEVAVQAYEARLRTRVPATT
ncbi:nitrite reductase small subunit NirD [Streptomyces sp. NPDC093085]|uniref:nitrite reductase small subunit NirD n=1 Tax=Streptomyces sp. NPDC093085 TaxID=3155068 RepID=UPI0034338588